MDDDGDGFTDAEEIEAGSDPLDANDEPLVGGMNLMLLLQALCGNEPPPDYCGVAAPEEPAEEGAL